MKLTRDQYPTLLDALATKQTDRYDAEVLLDVAAYLRQIAELERALKVLVGATDLDVKYFRSVSRG